MKKIIVAAFIAGLSFFALESNAQTGTYSDAQGTYRYETREERVWVPERRTGGIFGVGGRTIPGHYETRTNQVKVYDNDRKNGQYGDKSKGWEGKHPHGMPPGQRKKQGQNGNYDNRNRDRNNDGVIDDRDRNYDRNGDGVIDSRDRNYDRNGDGVIDSRDRNYDRNGDGVIDSRDREYDRNKDGVIDSRDRTYRNGDSDDDDNKDKNSKGAKKAKKNK